MWNAKQNIMVFCFALRSVFTIFGRKPKVGCTSAMKAKKCFLLCIALGFHYLCKKFARRIDPDMKK